ncbi:MAG: haloacid dehalogenase-like hydrolase, partial [Anaerococcus sp.]|nr:haloacid dehalogenase-like hydrolase [Anaerococcus sp.]
DHSKEKVYKMIKDNRIKYFAPADYRENQELDLIIKNIIERTVFNEKLESTHYSCLKEASEF